jgi:hypothetical protein
MALRAKTALAHPSPIKPVSATLSGGAKVALYHDRKVATLCHFQAPRLRGPSCPAAPCSPVDTCSKKPKKAPLCLIFSQALDAFQRGELAPHLLSPLLYPVSTAPSSASAKPHGARAPEGAPQFRPMYTASHWPNAGSHGIVSIEDRSTGTLTILLNGREEASRAFPVPLLFLVARRSRYSIRESPLGKLNERS